MAETERLLLRPPRLDDADAFAELNTDPEVMRFISPTGALARAESDLLLRRLIGHWDDHGFGLWMAELREGGGPIGFVGLQHPQGLPALAGEVEVGWRFAREQWGKGLATEGGAAAVRTAFDERGLHRLVCIVDRDNHASLGVARKLGFAFWRDMDHPRWPRGVQIHTLERAGSDE